MAEDLLKKIQEKIEKMVTLEITTAVGEVEVDPASGKTNVKGPAMFSRIDLLQGDIVTAMHTEFVTGQYVDLRAFHEERVKEGHAIVEGNIKALKALIELFRKANAESS